MHSPLRVLADVTRQTAGDRVNVAQSVARRESQADVGEDDEAGAAFARQPRVGEMATRELCARTAMALGALMAQIREALERLAQIEEEPVATGRRDVMASVLAKVKRGDRLAGELLAYSEHQSLVPRAVELMPLLCSLAHLLRLTLGERIDVTVQIADDCPPCQVDEHALEEALINLAINARDAMVHGAGRLQLVARLARPVHGAPNIALTLVDSGIGMARDIAQCAESPFFTTKANDPLAGLGLAAVEGFVRQSGGSMQLQTSIGVGTSVTLFLPSVGPER